MVVDVWCWIGTRASVTSMGVNSTGPSASTLQCSIPNALYHDHKKYFSNVNPAWTSVIMMVADDLVPIWHQAISNHHADLIINFQEKWSRLCIWNIDIWLWCVMCGAWLSPAIHRSMVASLSGDWWMHIGLTIAYRWTGRLYGAGNINITISLILCIVNHTIKYCYINIRKSQDCTYGI